MRKRFENLLCMSDQFQIQEEHFTYIPLSSFIILLVILFTCASRKRKLDSFTSAEQSLENDIKGDYAIMCFPCLKKKPEFQDYEPTTEMANQFEYVVEKYTIRKVPLLLANTAEDLLERQVELEMAENQVECPPEMLRDNFVNFQMNQEPQCLTVAANTICPGRKSVKEKCLPSDILESMSPIPRPNVKNANYVVIPTKGSLRSKDIMITKREITNQYLNNFSSVFVDNLKDQVPKDPERFPNLSRPYTSAFKNLPLAETFLKAKTTNGKKVKRSKVQKVAYSFPAEDGYSKEDDSIKEEDAYYDSDSGSKDQTTDAPDSEFQEDNENEMTEMTDKSNKSLVLLNDSDSAKDALEGTINPFKTTIKSSGSEFIPRVNRPEFENQSNSFAFQKEDWTNAKVTYEDIQALDVGYEFTSCEKLGVKPKMTRIHYPHEGDRTKDVKQVGDSKTSRKTFYITEQPQHQISSPKVARSNLKSKGHQRISDLSFLSNLSHPKEKQTSKCSIAETSFLPRKDGSNAKSAQPEAPNFKDLVSTTTFTSKSEESKSQSLNDIDIHGSPSEGLDENVAEISRLYDLAMPVTKSAVVKPTGTCDADLTTKTTAATNHPSQDEDAATSSAPKFPMPSKSRSFQESRKETASEVKGKDYSPYPSSFVKNKSVSRLVEPETETSSMLSRESKTSSVVTSPRSSEREEGKRATLRWKIVIKHHREEDSSRKHVNKNIKI